MQKNLIYSSDPLEASQQTSYPGNEQAGYEELLSDPSAYDTPNNNVYGNRHFNENLALHLDDGTLQRIGGELTEAIQNDDDARQKWLRINTQGIEYLGIGGDRNKNVYSAGSTDVFAVTLMKATLNACAEIYTNIFPASGFIETEVLGEITTSQEKHANRIKELMNYVITDVMEEYKADKKQGILWMILEGSVFTKVYIDRLKDKPAAPYIRASDVIIDAGATSLEDAERISCYFTLSERALEERFIQGEWRRQHIEMADLQAPPIHQKVDQKIGVMPNVDETSKYYAFYESFTYSDFESKGRKLPYLVIKDKNSNSVVGLYRNWEEFDPKFRAKKYLVQHKYFTGFNIYGLGLIHLALGLAKAETDIQQEILKAAQLSNAPSLLMKSTLRSEKTQIDIKPGSLNQFQSFDSDLPSSLMPLPFRGPDAAFMQLKENLANDINAFSVFRNIDPKEMPANMPAATMVGVLSTLHTLENSLMNDLYDSFRKEFQLLYNVIGEWLPDTGYPFKMAGSQGVIMKNDFSPNVSIKPVMDPNISSNSYKLIVGDALLNLAKESPDLYNMREIHKRLLTSMKVSNIDELLQPEPEENPPPPPERDPLSENEVVMKGEPIKAYKDQDHQSHRLVHQNLIDQLSNDTSEDHSDIIAQLKSHNQEHKTFEYMIHMEQITGIQLPEDPTQIPLDMQNQIAQQAAAALSQEKEQQEAQNPAPIDPNAILMEEVRVKEKEVDVRSAENQTKLQIDQLKIENEARKDDMKLQIELKRLELEERRLILEEKKLMIEHEDSIRKSQVEAARIELDQERTHLEAESKAYDATLKHEGDKEIAYAKIASEDEKNHLDAETKSFDSTLNFEKDIKDKNKFIQSTQGV